jgi:integrase/recombinase XerD
MVPLDALARGGGTIPARPDLTRAQRWRMKLSKAVELFMQEVRVTRAKLTVAGYESDLTRLLAICAAQQANSVFQFTPDLVRRFFLTESERGNRMSTLHRKMATLSEFGKWGVRQRIWSENPVASFPKIKRPKLLPRPFGRDEAQRLLALDLPALDRVVRALLFGTGLRVSPLCTLKIGDVTFDPPVIRAVVKGDKPQVIPMPPAVKELVYAYVLAHTDLKGHSWLLTQRSGRPYNRRLLAQMTHRWGTAARVPDCTPHRFRHTFATAMLEEGTDLRLVQAALGHEDIKSTTLYTEVTQVALTAAMQRLPWAQSGQL